MGVQQTDRHRQSKGERQRGRRWPLTSWWTSARRELRLWLLAQSMCRRLDGGPHWGCCQALIWPRQFNADPGTGSRRHAHPSPLTHTLSIHVHANGGSIPCCWFPSNVPGDWKKKEKKRLSGEPGAAAETPHRIDTHTSLPINIRSQWGLKWPGSWDQFWLAPPPSLPSPLP